MRIIKPKDGVCSTIMLQQFEGGWDFAKRTAAPVAVDSRDFAYRLLRLDVETDCYYKDWRRYKVIYAMPITAQNVGQFLLDCGFRLAFTSGAGENTYHPGTILQIYVGDPLTVWAKCEELTKE